MPKAKQERQNENETKRVRTQRKGKVFVVVLFEDITKSIKILFPAIKLPKVK